jgi:hypothetical protein
MKYNKVLGYYALQLALVFLYSFFFWSMFRTTSDGAGTEQTGCSAGLALLLFCFPWFFISFVLIVINFFKEDKKWNKLIIPALWIIVFNLKLGLWNTVEVASRFLEWLCRSV